MLGFGWWMERLVLADEAFLWGRKRPPQTFNRMIIGECCLWMASLMEIMTGAVAAKLEREVWN